MSRIDPTIGARGAGTSARPMDIAPRPLTGPGRTSPSSMVNRASNHSHQNPDAMAAWRALLAASPSANPGLRPEPERRNARRQYAIALVEEFRSDLYNKTALLTCVTEGFPKTSGHRIAKRYIDMLSLTGFFAQRTDWLANNATEGWLQKGKQMLRQHGYIRPLSDGAWSDEPRGASDMAFRRFRMSNVVPRKRDILFKLELFTACPYEYSPLDFNVRSVRENPSAEDRNIALLRRLLAAWRLGAADFGVAGDPQRFEDALEATARQTPRPQLANLLDLATSTDAQQWVAEEFKLRPVLNRSFDAVVRRPHFAQTYRQLVTQEKARFPQWPTPAEVRAERRTRRDARAEQLLRAAAAAQKTSSGTDLMVAQSHPKSL